MTEDAEPKKLDPETLVLRAKSRPAIRIRRDVLIAVVGIGCIGLATLTWLGLNPSAIGPAAPAARESDPERHAPDLPDQVRAGPKTYADVPQLGAPLPGDLGRPILEHQRAHGMDNAEGARASRSDPPPAAAMPKSAALFFAIATSTAAGKVAAPAAIEPTDVSASVGLAGLSAPANASDAANIAGVVNAHRVRQPPSNQMVMAGTVISASLITGLKSDLPGLVLAQITMDVRDTLTGQVILIPKGARLIGKYDNAIAFGQSRVLVVWQRIIWPDGRSLEIDNVPGTDAAGFAGLSDHVDYHTVSLLKGIGLSTLLGVAAELGRDSDDTLVEALRRSTQETANQAGQKIVARQLDVAPSLAVRPGWPLRVIVQKDLDISPVAEEAGS